jgi:hypothetical protein
MDLLKNSGFLMCAVLILNGSAVLAQDHDHDHDHDHSHHHHEHPNNEFGVGHYLSYLAGEKEFAYSLHIHYLRFFSESRFGTGIGYEQIFDEHGHRSLTIIGTYQFASHLILSLAPGILFGNPENPTARFVLHTEVIYEIEIGNFHFGPALELATTFEEYHIGLGIHMAFAF